MEQAVAELYKMIEKLSTDEEFAKGAFVGKPDGNPVALGPRVKSAEDWEADMAEGAKARSKRWLTNTLLPSKNPKEAALKAEGKWAENVTRAVKEKRFAAGIQNYDETAKEAVIKEGGERAFTDGIDRHRPKALAKIKKLQPLTMAVALAGDKDKVDTDADREAKVIKNIKRMREVGKLMKGLTGSVEGVK